MARTARINKASANYHIISRTNGKQFFFTNGKLKSAIVGILHRVAEFSGVKVHAYCLMDDHFHLVCNIVKNEEPLSEREVIRRIGRLKGLEYAGKIAEKLLSFRKNAAYEQAESELDKWRKRMNDVSEFTKTFKELVNIAYKKYHPYCGSIWSGRFKSTLIEDGRYLRNCIRYVELNPVRARMVAQAKDYAWSSRNALSSGNSDAGSVPEKWLMRRVAQIGDGKIFGSFEFVTASAFAFGDKFQSRSVSARAVGELGYATHGWRLAKMMAS